MFVAVCLFFFAFSTILSWNLFGKINMVYLLGKKFGAKTVTVLYTVVALVFIFWEPWPPTTWFGSFRICSIS